MNRIVEDRLLIDECERALLVLKDVLKGTGLKLGIKATDDLLEKIKKHREKFTRRVLDKQAYIKKNKALFDAIYAHDSRRVAGSLFEKRTDEIYRKANEASKEVFSDLVADGFYSAKTARMDAIRSLMTTYEKLFIRQ